MDDALAEYVFTKVRTFAAVEPIRAAAQALDASFGLASDELKYNEHAARAISREDLLALLASPAGPLLVVPQQFLEPATKSPPRWNEMEMEQEESEDGVEEVELEHRHPGTRWDSDEEEEREEWSEKYSPVATPAKNIFTILLAGPRDASGSPLARPPPRICPLTLRTPLCGESALSRPATQANRISAVLRRPSRILQRSCAPPTRRSCWRAWTATEAHSATTASNTIRYTPLLAHTRAWTGCPRSLLCCGADIRCCVRAGGCTGVSSNQ